jgi:hypothetical protein
MAEKFIQKAIKRPGALHRALKVPMGEKIPMKKIKKAEHSKKPLLRQEANFAETLSRVRPHKKGGCVMANKMNHRGSARSR